MGGVRTSRPEAFDQHLRHEIPPFLLPNTVELGRNIFRVKIYILLGFSRKAKSLACQCCTFSLGPEIHLDKYFAIIDAKVYFGPTLLPTLYKKLYNNIFD